MKPKDLKYPFEWETRCPVITDGVLYIPKYYSSHHGFEQQVLQNYFGNDNNFFDCELCSGNGDWVVSQAQQHPQVNWICVEQRFDRVRKIWSKRGNAGIQNLLIVCGDAQLFLKYYAKSNSIRRLFVNFPDPWPKHRHHKHRLFQDPFICSVVNVLQPSGKISLVTDDAPFLLFALKAMEKKLKPTIQAPHFQQIDGEYGGSWFENLWRSKGKMIFYTEFEKVGI